MNLDFGMYVLIFCGMALCCLYFWSAIKERARRLARLKRELAQFREAQAKRARIVGAAPGKPCF